MARVGGVPLQVYLPKKAATGSTSFVTRLLRFSRGCTEQKCVSRRGGPSWCSVAITQFTSRELGPENRDFSALPSKRCRDATRNRAGVATLLWQCRGPMAPAFVLE